jgi:hypothetical protein
MRRIGSLTRRYLLTTAVGLAAMFLLSPRLLAAQTPAAIAGVVEDESGAPIPGATVILAGQKAAATYSTVSQTDGTFTVEAVPDSYVLKVELSGFDTVQRTVQVGVGGLKALKLTLRVASVKQEVKVVADVLDELSTSGTTAGTTRIDEEMIRALPIASDDVFTMISRFVSPLGVGIDGGSIVVDGIQGAYIDMPSSAIESLKVNRNPYSAAFQYPGNSRIEIGTKRGHRSRRLDGSFQTSSRGSMLASRSGFATSPDLDRRVFQANAGGTLPGEKSAFYVAARRYDINDLAAINAETLAGPVVKDVPTFARNDSLFTRVQWWPSALNTVYVTYGFSDHPARNHEAGGFNVDGGFDAGQKKHKVALNQNLLLPPNWSNNLLVSVSQQDDHEGGPATAPFISVNDAFETGPPSVYELRTKRGFDVQNTMRYYGFSGHTLLFGARAQANTVDSFNGSNFAGTFEFGSLADYAAGRPEVFRINEGDGRAAYTVYEGSGFVQDEIVLKRQLTLTYGVRYDWQSTVHDRNNFAPRLAFVFVPPGSDKTIIRGGSGIFYDNLPRSVTEDSQLFDGVRVRETVIDDPSYPNPFGSGESIETPPSAIRVAPFVRSPYVAQTSLSVERELWPRSRVSAEYVMARGVHLFRSRNINVPLPETGLRPDPAFLNINQVESTAFARSHALTVSWQGRVGKLFRPYVQYVLSHTINNTSGALSLPANNFDLRPETGPADFDQRHRVNMVGSLALPRGIQTGLVLAVGSGVPYDITTGYDDNDDTLANDRPAGGSRNTGRSPRTLQLDLRFAKNLNFRAHDPGQKRDGLDFTVDVFNALNRTNVTQIIGAASSPFFGRANSALPARTVQFSLRYAFRR